MTSNSTVSVRTFRQHLTSYELLGRPVDYDYIENNLGIDLDAFTSEEERIPIENVYRLVNYVADRDNDPLLGLNHALGQFTSYLKNAKSISLISTSPVDFIELLSRFLCIASEVGSLSWNRPKFNASPDTVCIHFNPIDPDHITYHQTDGILLILKEAVENRFAIQPSCINFRHSCPGDLGNRYTDFFGCNVVFDQATDHIEYRGNELLRPVDEPHQDINILASIERDKQAHHRSSVSNSVTFLLERQLLRGDPSRESIAKLLFLSVRTLQRKLAQEGTTYQTLLEETRKQRALHFLSSPSHSHNQIALWLGYTEASQYYQAFKRWFGQSAKDYRR